MRQKMAVPWMIFALIMNGCVPKLDLPVPTYTNNAPDQKNEPLKPRAIEEWIDPDDQELARRLVAIDEQRKTLNALMEDLWNARTNRKASRISSIGETKDDATRVLHQQPNVEPLLLELHSHLK